MDRSLVARTTHRCQEQEHTVSRVHCLECAGPVVLDPRGVCPEGHHVGAAGARVEQAMGHEQAHPDEPEPWVYRIDPSELTVVGAGTNGMGPQGAGRNGTAPRQARPVRVPGFDQDGDDTGSDAESLLRELHSLAAFDQQQADAAAPPSPVNGASTRTHRAAEEAQHTAPPPPPGQEAEKKPRAPRPDPDAMADAFAELSALDAPAQAMTPRSSANGRAHRADGATSQGPGPAAADSDAQLDHDELASLFSTPPAKEANSRQVAADGDHHGDTRTNAAGPGHAPGSHAPTNDVAPLPPSAADTGYAAAVPDKDDAPRAADPPGRPPAPPAHPPAPAEDHLEVDGTELAFELSFGDDEPSDAAHPDIAQLLDEMTGDAGLFGGTSGTGSAPVTPQATQPATPPATQPSPAPDPAPPHEPAGGQDAAAPEVAAPEAVPPAATPTSETDPAPAEDASRTSPPDLTSFTARGGSAGRGGKRRLFGR